LHRKHKFSLLFKEFSLSTTKLNAARPELDFTLVAAERQYYKGQHNLQKERERERERERNPTPKKGKKKGRKKKKKQHTNSL
jgi:hypothetical protein